MTARPMGLSSWCWAAEVSLFYDFLAAQNLGAGSGSAPSKCSSTRRRGGRPMLCRRATVSWPR